MTERPLHVCHITSALDHGGLEQLLVDMAAHGPALGIRHSFVSLGPLGPTAEALEAAGAEVASVDLLGDRRRGWGRLVEVLRARRPDVVHCHNTYAQCFGATAARRAGVRARLTTQHGPGGGSGWRLRGYYLAGNRWVQRIVAVSADGLTHLRREDPLVARKLVHITNGVPVGPVPGPGPRHGVLAVGRLAPEKDHLTLVRAWAQVVAERPGATVHILGDGPHRAAVEAEIERLGLSGAVVLEGYRDDVSERLRSARLYVSSSQREGVSLALLEAMAAGACCVVTDVGDQADVLGPDPYGEVVPVADPDALARALSRWLAAEPDPAAAERAHGRVAGHWSIEATARVYADLYRELAGR